MACVRARRACHYTRQKDHQASMSHGLIAKKIGMSRVFLQTGEAVPVTYLRIEPNTILRTKKQERDGYNAIVLGVGPKLWKTRKGTQHTRYAVIKEWKVDNLDSYVPGGALTAEQLTPDSTVTISGISKGKGFQGVIKRHHFSCGPMSHGSHHHREPGSVGMREQPGRVLRGKKLPGHMGGECVTTRHCRVVTCDPSTGLIAIKGPVPGPNGSRVFLTIES